VQLKLWFRTLRHTSRLQRAKMSRYSSVHLSALATSRMKVKALTLAYRSIIGSAPPYFHLLRVHVPTRSLRSANERRLVVPSQKVWKRKRISLQNILIHGSWWYSPSPEMQNLWQHSKDNWKLISSAQHLTSYKNKKINKNLSFSLSPPNAFHGLFLALYDDSI